MPWRLAGSPALSKALQRRWTLQRSQNPFLVCSALGQGVGVGWDSILLHADLHGASFARLASEGLELMLLLRCGDWAGQEIAGPGSLQVIGTQKT